MGGKKDDDDDSDNLIPESAIERKPACSGYCKRGRQHELQLEWREWLDGDPGDSEGIRLQHGWIPCFVCKADMRTLWSADNDEFHRRAERQAYHLKRGFRALPGNAGKAQCEAIDEHIERLRTQLSLENLGRNILDWCPCCGAAFGETGGLAPEYLEWDRQERRRKG